MLFKYLQLICWNKAFFFFVNSNQVPLLLSFLPHTLPFSISPSCLFFCPIVKNGCQQVYMYLNPYLRLQQNTNRSLHRANLSPLHPIYPQQEKKSISYISRCLHQKFRQVTFACHLPTTSNLPKPNILAKSLSNMFTLHNFPVPSKSRPRQSLPCLLSGFHASITGPFKLLSTLQLD